MSDEPRGPGLMRGGEPTNRYAAKRPYCKKHSRACLDIGGEKKCPACVEEQRKQQSKDRMTQPDLVSKLRELVAKWRKRAENGEAAIKHQGWGDATPVYILIGCADELESLLGLEGQAALNECQYCNRGIERKLIGVHWSHPIGQEQFECRYQTLDVPPSTPIVPSTAGLSEIGIVKAILSAHQTAYAKFHNGEGRNVIESDGMAIGYASVELAKLLSEREARIRKDVMEEAAQVCEQVARDPNLDYRDERCAEDICAEKIRALAERPAPAGEARILRWQCPHCAHVNSMTSANCENCKIPLVNTAR